MFLFSGILSFFTGQKIPLLQGYLVTLIYIFSILSSGIAEKLQQYKPIPSYTNLNLGFLLMDNHFSPL